MPMPMSSADNSRSVGVFFSFVAIADPQDGCKHPCPLNTMKTQVHCRRRFKRAGPAPGLTISRLTAAAEARADELAEEAGASAEEPTTAAPPTGDETCAPSGAAETDTLVVMSALRECNSLHNTSGMAGGRLSSGHDLRKVAAFWGPRWWFW